MISVEGLKVEFGIKPLFSDATFVVNARDRIALVGKNGAGKSTLLKIICGQERATAGSVNVQSDTTIGYLPQVMNLQDRTTVREEAQKAFADIHQLKARLDRMEHAAGKIFGVDGVWFINFGDGDQLRLNRYAYSQLEILN